MDWLCDTTAGVVCDLRIDTTGGKEVEELFDTPGVIEMD